MNNINNAPGIVADLKSMPIRNTPFTDYCELINSIVLKMASTRGKRKFINIATTAYVYEDGYVKLTYIDSEYGNDKYCVEINRSIWDDIPEGINPFLVNEGSDYNLVYEYILSREQLLFHLPGNWLDFVKQYAD